MASEITSQMSQWEKAGFAARIMNFDGEPPLTISIENRESWRTGYRKACEWLDQGGAA